MAGWVAHPPKFLLFGDSITSRSFDAGGWGAGLANAYARKADVINRGFGGYNTRWAKHILDQILDDVCSGQSGPPALATVFFGANDAVTPSGPSGQHVPLPEYKDNLKHIVTTIKGRGITSVLLITPPPIYEAGYAKAGWPITSEGPDRTHKRAQDYAVACKEVAKEIEVPFVDLYTAMQEENWGEKYFNDGLHLTPDGNQSVYRAVAGQIDASFPHLRADGLPLHYPSWDAVDRQDPASSFPAPPKAAEKA